MEGPTHEARNLGQPEREQSPKREVRQIVPMAKASCGQEAATEPRQHQYDEH